MPVIIDVFIELRVDVNNTFDINVLICHFRVYMTLPVFIKLLMMQILSVLITNSRYSAINYLF